MSGAQWAAVAVGAGLGTYLLRITPFLLDPGVEMPRRIRDFLVYTSLAIAAGIVAKALMAPGEAFSVADTAIRLAALGVALGLFVWRRNILLSLMTAVVMAAAIKAAIG